MATAALPFRHFVLATAGHVDHGKTALIKALTDTETDRLPEERARGITIDLGFAHLALPGLSLGVIDVPGHEDFVRNMIAGIGSIDLALLVVAADDGWMPQTEEHLQILEYLRVPRLVVALTKADLGAVVRRTEEVRKALQGTRLAEAPIVATSTRDGTGIDALRETLGCEFAALPRARDFGKPRLFVDRVFSLRGTGTIVTGTLTGGQLTRGATIEVQPQKKAARIRAIQSHNQTVEIAEPGTRTALNLPEVRTEEIGRGAVITAAGAGESSRTIDVLLERSARLPASSRRCRSGALVHVHYGSARFAARVTLLGGGELRPGETAIARLRLTEPVFVFTGDRFIVRDVSEQQTIAGGVVLDADAAGMRLRAPAQRTFLHARAAAPNECEMLLRTLLARDQVLGRPGLLAKSRCSAGEVLAAAAQLEAEGIALPRGELLVAADWWRGLRTRAAAAIEAEHRAHSEHAGLELNQLRTLLALQPPGLFDALVAEMRADGFVQAGSALRRVNHQLTLPPNLRLAGDRIRAQLDARPFDPPSRKELAPGAEAQQALRFLCQTNEVVALGEEVLLSASAFGQMKTRVVQFLRTKQSATLSEVRQALGSTRRIVVPLLERLDREGVTVRRGDLRSLR